jgi:hypothetical protein
VVEKTDKVETGKMDTTGSGGGGQSLLIGVEEKMGRGRSDGEHIQPKGAVLYRGAEKWGGGSREPREGVVKTWVFAGRSDPVGKKETRPERKETPG